MSYEVVQYTVSIHKSMTVNAEITESEALDVSIDRSADLDCSITPSVEWELEL